MFKFPKIKRDRFFQYKNNFLKSVVFQFKYPEAELVVSKEELWRDELQAAFPNIKTMVKGEIHLDIKNDKTPLFQSSKSTTQGFEFRTKNNDKIIAFNSDAFTFTILGSAYTNFDDTFNQIKNNYFPLLEEAGVKEFNRVAIRKINLFSFSSEAGTPPSLVLPSVFNDALVGNISFFPSQEFITSGVTKLTFKDSDYQLNVIYGLVEKTPAIEHEQIVLDIDLFKSKSLTPIIEVPPLMLDINNEIFNIFNWALEKSLLDSLDSLGEESK